MGKWKLILAAALVLPMLAYVAGSLAAAGDAPGDRSPIRIDEPTGTSGTPTDLPSRTPKPPKKSDGPRTVTAVPDDLDDATDDDGRDDDRHDGRDDDGPDDDDGGDDD
ncbi:MULTISPECIES: hypothetical protein [unclassified Nocardioides]|uniref:hypothetical protein n=1 Tax=unclassified Nocardioides TaxID=2615069 RepID=UPI0006F43957|nr:MULTISPECIES: hypothetical protein [unclassified Nocardioides]KQY51684.1 hypothetical protein ASD30_20180 [Nocardioides sp. Root140]KQZ70748.1 hypothetical protein ASD66_14340 [Nocardioides sp. Root151]